MPSRPVPPPRGSRLPFLALLVANLALACGPWLVRLSERDAGIGPIGSAFWRLALALPVLVAASRIAGERIPPAGRRLLPLAGLSGLFFAIDLASWHAGILHTRLANATLLGNISALLFPAYGFIVLRAWPNRRQTLALALAAIGAGVLLGRSLEISAVNLRGDLLSLFAGLCYTFYLVAVTRVRAGLGPLVALSASVAVSAPVLLLMVLASGEPLWPQHWAPLIALAVGSQLIGQGLVLYSVKRVSALAVGLMLLVQPFFSGVVGWLFYGERLTLLDGVGALAIAAAILLVRERSPRLQPDEISLSD